MSSGIILAAAQIAPVVLDLNASVLKVCSAIREAAKNDADLIVFPEAFLPSYPFWVWFVPAGRTKVLRDLYSSLVESSVDIDGDAVRTICDAAKDARINVILGVNERSSESSRATLFNSLLFITSKGVIAGRHRKLVPTVGERMVHGRGDGSSLQGYDLPGVGRVGGLICWENYMPLVRYTLYADGVQILAAPTWDRGEPWLSTIRHIAKEGRVFVIGCCSAIKKDQIGDLADKLSDFLPDSDWINPGGSAIVDPDGKLMTEPLMESEGILYAEVDRSQFTGPRYQLDVAGHYARPDIFELRVNKRPQTADVNVLGFEEEIESVDLGNGTTEK
ncbi:MAG: carbon-nitrogen hydrolase family protein [Rhodothermia bacterium]|nr:carbon-nitrogen hydrolase family protein [Rhodothermia bacterium]NNE35721.1 carbon-nitrogen hydrolase family protein [Rhodothermales bacterium]